MFKRLLCVSIFALPALFIKAQSGASAAATADPNAAEMSFATKDHDFGTINQDDNGTTYFIFTNTGKEPLVIKEAHGSCGCTVPRWPHGPVAPGGTDTIKVTYDTHRVGIFHKTVTITSNAKESPDVLKIEGKVLAKSAQPDFSPDASNNSSGAPFSNNWDNQ